MGVLRIVGYCLLVLGLVNWVDILVPPQLMNPVWEFQTIGAIVESAPIPLIAMAFILFGNDFQRRKGEALLVRLLSYFCILLAIAFLILVPVTFSTVFRIYNQIDQQTWSNVEEQNTRLDEIEQQLTQATDQEVENFLRGRGVDLESQTQTEPGQTPKELILERLDEVRGSITTQSTETKANQKRATLKSAIKWTIGALLSGFTFIYLWRQTRWLNKFRTRKPAKHMKGF